MLYTIPISRFIQDMLKLVKTISQSSKLPNMMEKIKAKVVIEVKSKIPMIFRVWQFPSQPQRKVFYLYVIIIIFYFSKTRFNQFSLNESRFKLILTGLHLASIQII